MTATAKEWDELWEKGKFSPKNPMNLETVSELSTRLVKRDAKFGPDFSGKVLDVATGDGRYAYMLAELWPKAHIIGVDYSQQVIGTLQSDIRSAKFKNLEFMFANALTLRKHLSMSFDLVFNPSMLEYMPDVSEHSYVMQSMKEVTVPGGVVFIGSTNRWCVPHELLKWWQGHRYRNFPEYSLTPEEVTALAVHAGLKGIESFGVAPHWGLQRLSWISPLFDKLGAGLGEAYKQSPAKEWFGSNLGFHVYAMGSV